MGDVMNENRIKQNSINISMVFVTLVIVGLLFCGIFLGSTKLSLVAFILNIIWYLRSRNDEIIFSLFFLIPFATVYKTTPSSTSLFTIVELVIVILFIIRARYVDKRCFIFSLIFVFYLFTVDTIRGDLSIAEYLRQFIGLQIIYFVIREYNEVDEKKVFLKKIILYFSFGVLVSSLFALAADNLPIFHSFVKITGYNSDLTNRFSGLNGDPNYYTINVILVLTCMIFLYSTKQINGLFWFIFGFFSIIGMTTYSKSFLLMYAIVLIVFLITLLKNKNRKGLMIFTLICTLALISFSKGRFDNISFIIERLNSSTNIASLTTGRSNVWIEYIDYLLANIDVLLIGRGVGATYLSKGVHNWYIEMFYYFGAIGTFLFCLALKSCFVRNNGKRESLVYYSGFVIVFTLYFFLQMVFSNELPFHLLLAFAILALPQSIREEKRETN